MGYRKGGFGGYSIGQFCLSHVYSDQPLTKVSDRAFVNLTTPLSREGEGVEAGFRILGYGVKDGWVWGVQYWAVLLVT